MGVLRFAQDDGFINDAKRWLPAFFSAEVGDVGGVVAGVPGVEEGGGFDGDATEFGVSEAALPLVFSK